MIRIWINGLWRIGRILVRLAEERNDMEIVAINSRADATSHAHLLQYDSTYGIRNKHIIAKEHTLEIEWREIMIGQYDDPANIPWDQRWVTCVIDATGKFKDSTSLNKHRKWNVKKVICSAPGKWLDKTIVLGVNEHEYNHNTHHLISNASCTTNCVAPILKLINDTLGVEYATFCTVHAVTATQNILDNSHKKNLRIARNCMESIIPSSTWASKAVAEIMPELQGKMHAYALRVPTTTVSFIDLVIQTHENTWLDELQTILKNAISPIIGVSEKPLVSVDYKWDTHSSIIDLPLTQVLWNKMIKICSWYDNERGYACRVMDLIKFVN